MNTFTGFGELNGLLTELQLLMESELLLSNSLDRADLERSCASTRASAYYFCQQHLMGIRDVSEATLAKACAVFEELQHHARKRSKENLTEETVLTAQASAETYTVCLKKVLDLALSLPLRNKVGLFGTCAGSQWRAPVMAKLDQVAQSYFNPEVAEWQPSRAAEETRNLANNRVLVFAITNEAYAVASLAEVGLAIAQVQRQTPPQELVLYVARSVCEDLQAQDGERAQDSNRARALVLAHLAELKLPHVHVVDSLEDIADKVLALLD